MVGSCNLRCATVPDGDLPVNTVAVVLLDLFIMFTAARVVGALFERLKQPAVIGELLVGVVLGPYVLGWVGVPNAAMLEQFHGDRALAEEVLHSIHHVIAELGVIILLYFVGLETRLADILRVGARASIIGVTGVVLPFVLGFGVSALLGYPALEGMFIGTALVATSVGITARVLRDMGRATSTEARIILGAAVIDDILAMVLLAVVSGMSTHGGIDAGSIALLVLQAVGFTVFVVLIGSIGVRRYSAHLDSIPIRNSPFVISMIIMLGLAALAANIGIAAIIGAFLAGMILAEAREHYHLESTSMSVYELLVPFFFVITGTQVDPRVFLDSNIIGLAAVITLVAVAGKLVAGALGGWGMGGRSMAIVGVGMVPRGEVGLIVAGIGRSMGAMPGDIFSVIVVMSLVTTLIAPPLLKTLYAVRPPPTAPVEEVGVEVEDRLEEYAAQDGRLPEM